MLAFGSFAVPIKSEAARSVDVDPLVFQSYKTLMCFLTSWLVLLLPGQREFTFTAWGIVSGLFWVPGGIATVYAVKAAGIAVASGVGSSFIVLVSFTWGIFIFRENVESKVGACLAIMFMILGICGMATFSSPTKDFAEIGDGTILENSSPTSNSGYQGLQREDLDSFSDDVDLDTLHDAPDIRLPSSPPFDGHIIWGRKVPRRTLGISAAIFCGIWGGSIMVPMHFSPRKDTGVGYTISFGIGASVVTIFLWILRFGYNVLCTKSILLAYQSLPSFHVRVMWIAGCTSGMVWSIGNFFSIISVEFLGEGVGYSVVQAAMLVSGLWGIFYYHEIAGVTRICCWMLSAMLTVSGIILLSYEHHKGVHI
jgi:glucose uptake protein GlcU